MHPSYYYFEEIHDMYRKEELERLRRESLVRNVDSRRGGPALATRLGSALIALGQRIGGEVEPRPVLVKPAIKQEYLPTR